MSRFWQTMFIILFLGLVINVWTDADWWWIAISGLVTLLAAIDFAKACKADDTRERIITIEYKYPTREETR